MKRRYSLLLASGVALSSLGGCSWWNGLTMRSQSPEETTSEELHVQLVGDLAVPTGVQPTRVEAIGLATGLHGKGSDPMPSPQRDALLEEMKARDFANPAAALASGDLSMVVIVGILRPGIQKGDRFDIEVRVPSQSNTQSLRGGYLLEARLAESSIEGGQYHKGKLLALAEGPIMIDPATDAQKDRIMLCRGRILGGGVALESRPLGLVLTPEHKGVRRNSAKIATAVNRRFHAFQNGVKQGMAKAITNELVNLKVHPRYKDNINRYIQVVRALPITESAAERMQRIRALGDQLLDPATAADAALQLEAAGAEGEPTLLKGLQSKNPEVRFYAAEALAYLDRREAAEPLGQIARDMPAFRVFALTALSAMQDFAAADQLREMLASTSAETRYGAFRAIWAANPKDPLVKGELLGDQFHYHALDVAGPPMIHVTRNRLAEVVLFGADQRFLTPLAINAGDEIMITSRGGDQITVSKYSVAEGDQMRTVSTRVDDVIHAVAELGGTYPDVVQALQEAKNSGALLSRYEVDALPEAGRTYQRVYDDEIVEGNQGEGTHPAEQTTKVTPASPSPDLFYKKPTGSSSKEGASNDQAAPKTDENSDEKAATNKGFFAKMFGR